MENPSQRIVVPNIGEVCDTNRLFILETGGAFYPPRNLLNPLSLQWALDRIQCPLLFGVDLYPELPDKAALLAWTIINDHVFYDGNKRTDMATIKIMVLKNGFQFNANDEEITEMARAITNYRESGITNDRLSIWIDGRIILVNE